MTRIRKILLAGMAAGALASGATTAMASHANEHTDRYQYQVGTGGALGPDITRDPATGYILEIVGQGTFTSGEPGSVAGGGTFVVTNSGAHLVAHGTWTAARLDSFQSYGTPSGFPDDVEGGLARIDISIHPAGTSRTLSGSLQIHCAINRPSSIEGVRVFVGAVNASFTQTVFGDTLFINRDSDTSPN